MFKKNGISFVYFQKSCTFAIHKQRNSMKKVSFLILALIAIILCLQSCKSSEHCPAYGEIETTQQADRA